ncbi:MAG: phospho-N-acetylmuramoyl-pentapeptide-transferase [Candidatus Faecousia sp.]|nr:phospho-N-acetylmuramoyl-pentapeptide-transferase [Candidatus Faecousia sp.]
MIRVIVMAVISCVLAALLGHFLLPVLRALKAGQSVRSIGPTWHNNKAGTPLMMGLMFIGSTLVCLLLNLPNTQEYSAIYVFVLAFCFGAIGFLDDYCKVRKKRDMGLTAIQKFLLQGAVSAVFLYVLYMEGILTCDLYIPFFNVRFYIQPPVYLLFSMFIIVGTVNAVNLTDGIDGLSASVTIPVMVFFVAVALKVNREELAVLPGAMIGGLIAFLGLNWHPAKAFMGDTGSLFMGGVVCGLAYALDMPLVLIFAGFVYLMETLSVILQVSYFKFTHGKRLFKMSPIHHHFEMSGWKEEKIVLTFAGVSAVMCVMAWLSISGIVG